MTANPGTRPALLRRALRLEYLTVGWNIVEGVVAIAAAMASGSVALLGFRIDSFVESASGSVMIWRLHAERRTTDEERQRWLSVAMARDPCQIRAWFVLGEETASSERGTSGRRA